MVEIVFSFLSALVLVFTFVKIKNAFLNVVVDWILKSMPRF